MKPAALQLHIGRVVWHGAGAPDAHALEAAIEAALVRALLHQESPVASSGLARVGETIAGQLLPRLPNRPR